MIHVDSEVPLVTDHPAPPVKSTVKLAEGDVIAMPFAGYGDLLVELTEPPHVNALGDLEAAVSDGRMSYTMTLAPAPAEVQVYHTNQKGQVRA